MLRALGLCLALLLAAPSVAAKRPLTVLISVDGFRADYLDRGVTPVLSALAAGGARGVMRPSFPSKTFPNHYTLVTGLRPDRHGVVDNNMEDPAIPGVTFRMSNHDAVTDRRWWDQGEPIWVTAERAGVVTATMFWPGSEAPIRGIRPRHWRAYDQKVPAGARVDQVLAWLDLPPPERPALVTLYFDDVDTAGHREGPDSAGVNAAAALVDAEIGRLAAGLKARGLAANLVIVADHGMAAICTDRVRYLDDLIAKDSFRMLADGVFAAVYPAPGREAEAAKAIVGRHDHFSCWPRAKIPKRLHYGRNPRVAPIFCLAQTGWLLTLHSEKAVAFGRGAHGYDNRSPEMAAIFVAHGPAFRAGVTLKTFDNVSVYPLLAHLVGVKPWASDGRLADVAGVLVDQREHGRGVLTR